VDRYTVDPRARPYGDPTWLRNNERKSLDWYAISILNTVQIVRKQIERGDVRLAVDLALDLGVLATEAKMIQYMAATPLAAARTRQRRDVLSLRTEHGGARKLTGCGNRPDRNGERWQSLN
jgi:hypothetical protein